MAVGTTMADPSEVNRMCNALGVSREEALYYLEGFDWDLASAMEACLVKTLPPVKVKSSPEVSVIEKSTAAESSATRVTINPPRISNQGSSTPSRTIDSRRSSNQNHVGVRIDSRRSWNQVPNPPKELSSELKKESIDRFREVAYGMSLQEVVTFLERFNWDVNIAVNHFMDQRNPQYTSDDVDDLPTIEYLQRLPENYIPMIGVSNLEGFSQEETSAVLAAEMMEHRGPPLPSLSSQSQFHASVGCDLGSSSSSGLMNLDVAETGDLDDVPLMSSSQMQIQDSSSPVYLQDLASAMEACCSKTLPPLKDKSLPGFSMNEISAVTEWESPTSTPVVINSRRISNDMRIQSEQLPPKKEELLSESKAGNIKQFCDVVGAPPQVAVAYLDRYKWHVDDAINYFMDECLGNSNPQCISEDDHSTMGQSNSQWPSEGDRSTTWFSEDVTSKALASERWQNMCPPVPLMGLPSQSQFQASGSSSSSLTNVDPTETEESLKEASDESVPVAIPLLASSQVDKKLKGKAIEEDSSTETFPDPLAIQDRTSVGHQAAPTTITISIVLADGGSGIPVDIRFRSEQTVRDIRNAIDELTQDNDRDYDLQSMAEVDCRDMNVTVGRIVKGGSTILLQVFPDP